MHLWTYSFVGWVSAYLIGMVVLWGMTAHPQFCGKTECWVVDSRLSSCWGSLSRLGVGRLQTRARVHFGDVSLGFGSVLLQARDTSACLGESAPPLRLGKSVCVCDCGVTVTHCLQTGF